jgi:poly-gamma-glutamate synthesis protein (capsule biosynthesis protein)
MFKKTIVLFLISLLVFSCFLAFDGGTAPNRVKDKAVFEDNTDSVRTLSVLFAGDIMMHMPQINAAATDSGYNFDSVFVFIKGIVTSCDIAVCNLETTMAGQPYSGYPQFSAPDALIDAIKNNGFDVIATANNHSADRGLLGITRTIDVVKEKGLLWVGTYQNQLQRDSLYPLVISKNGFNVSLLNATYGTNGLPVPTPALVNSLDTNEIKKDLEKVTQSDIVIPFLHWGLEYQRKHNAEQERLALWLAGKKITQIVGSHPHVVQDLGFFKRDADSFFVAYSLGNLVSNQRERYKWSGIMVKLNFEKYLNSGTKKMVGFDVIPYHVHKTSYPVKYYILPLPIAADSMNISVPDTMLLNESLHDNLQQIK